MKKAVSFILALVMALSLCSCGVSLTAEQQDARERADGLLAEMTKLASNSTFDSEVKTVDGKLLYIGTLDCGGKFNAVNAFQSHVMPYLKEIFDGTSIYVVLYVKEHGKDLYRFIDPALDPSILD